VPPKPVLVLSSPVDRAIQLWLSSFGDLQKTKIALAVSGGGDSMALALAVLHQLHYHPDLKVYCLTVDHGLRPQSKSEAKYVSQSILDRVKKLNLEGRAFHHILRWQGVKPKTGLQEKARQKRYELLYDFCSKKKIEDLALAHHQEDQFETFLFRLSKASGLDGLGAMKPQQSYNDKMTLHRPFLNLSHQDLIAYCQRHSQQWVEDPSNQSDRFARIRLRQAAQILKTEGLTAERISVVAERMQRASVALQFYLNQEFQNYLMDQSSDQISFSADAIQNLPEEILLRLVQKAMGELAKAEGQKLKPVPFSIRLEALEKIVFRLKKDSAFRSATLGGFIIKYSRTQKKIIIQRETR
jgi:tRNA(Ile)-lysidine synthase